MTPSKCFAFAIVALLLPATAPAGDAVKALLDGFASVPQLTCELRRDLRSGDGETVRFLSRIWFRRPDHLHAENLSPMKRRTVCDGTTLRQYTEGLPRGFARPVSELEGDALVNLRMLPGSNANWLEPFRDLPENELPAEGNAVRRVACTQPGKAYAVLSFDTEGRWFRLEMYASGTMADRLLRADMEDFAEVAPGVWLARRQKIDLSMEGSVRTETVRLDNLSATAPIPDAMFDAESFFPGVTFTDSFEKMF